MRVRKNTIGIINILIITTFLILSSTYSCAKKEPEVIKIGAVFSMTGDVGAYGQRTYRGFMLALEEINNDGGINGKRLETVVEDARSSSKDGVAAFLKLVTIDKVNIIVGDVLSSTTLAMVPLLNKYPNVILFAPGASNPNLKGAHAHFFRNWSSDDFDGFAMAHYLRDSNISEVGLIVQKSDYTVGLATAFTNEFKSLGGEIIKREEFDTEATDFKTQITKLKEAKVKTVYLIGQSQENGFILRQSRELKYEPIWYANLTVDTPECARIAGDARENIIFSTPAFDVNSQLPQVKKFVEDYRKKYDEEPESTAGHAYDALNILATVMKKVGINADDISQEIKGIKNFPGVTGNTTFDEYGGVKKNIFIKIIRGNKALFVREFNY